MAVTKTGLTAAALGVTAYGRFLGRRVSEHTDVPVESGTTPVSGTPAHVVEAQKRLKVVQWAIPALTGALVVISALAGEQQRPSEVRKGVFGRLAA